MTPFPVHCARLGFAFALLAVLVASCTGSAPAESEGHVPAPEKESGSLGGVAQSSSEEPPTGDPDRLDEPEGPAPRESRRLPVPGLPFESVPPPGRDEVLQALALSEDRSNRTAAEVAAAVNRSLGDGLQTTAALIDIVLTETNLASSEQRALLLTLATRNRVDVLTTVYDHASAIAARFMFFCGDCEPGAAQRSLARELRDSVVDAAELVHSVDARQLLDHVADGEAASPLPESAELRERVELLLASW